MAGGGTTFNLHARAFRTPTGVRESPRGSTGFRAAGPISDAEKGKEVERELHQDDWKRADLRRKGPRCGRLAGPACGLGCQTFSADSSHCRSGPASGFDPERPMMLEASNPFEE